MVDSCATCFFFRADAAAAPFDGRCRFYAPPPLTLGQQAATQSPWAPVLLADWCGEFSAIAPASSPTYRDFVCQFTPAAGAFGGASVISARWMEIGKFMTFSIHAHIVTNGTGAGSLQFTLPTIAAFDTPFAGMRNGNLNLMGRIFNGTNAILVTDGAGAYPGIDAADYYLSGVLEQE